MPPTVGYRPYVRGKRPAPVWAGGLWTPANLGGSLLGWWDAEQASSMTVSGGTVSSWRDRVAGYDLAQGTVGNQPSFNATSFNSRPSVTFDGTDDYLDLAPAPFPIAAVPSEIWALVSQDALAADATTRDIFGYGGGVNSRRTLRRTINAGANTFTALSGSGGAAALAEVTTPAFTGIHVVRLVQTATDVTAYVDGGAGVTTAVVPNTSNTRVRMGARSDTLSNFFLGKMNTAIVTSLLDASQAAQLTAFLKSRGGIP